MKASMDTNVLIHFYRADLQEILFSFFPDGVYIYEQIRNVELEHHGQDILEKIDADIESGRIEVFTDEKLKGLYIYTLFEERYRENRNLYSPGDLGEVFAISLAQTLGAFALVTDDIKPGFPEHSTMKS